ncbi:hypothetical protein [Hirschia litorea]|uniref:Uncharacterized protein n=1 Tax=Hirschia litorea TaxID=1199156 RepID=A0ABW2IN71_9PROT
MSVLQFSRRQDVIAEEPAIVEIDKPIPLKFKPVERLKQSGLPKRLRKYFIILASMALVLAYPVLVLQANHIDDDLTFPESINQNWSSPWAGVGTQILLREANVHGWTPDAPAWSPSARLTAMPAYQMAIAHAVGDFAELVNQQMGEPADTSLNSVALLLSRDVSANEIRAASEALTSFDGGVRLRRFDDSMTTVQYAQRIELLISWMRQSEAELSSIVDSAKGQPFDRDAVEAVYRSKARAYMAHRFVSYMKAPAGLSIRSEMEASLKALEKGAKFSPVFVLNTKADGLLLASHPTALYRQLLEAERVLSNMAQTVRAQSL